MSRKFFGLLAVTGVVLLLAGVTAQTPKAEAGFLFFGHGGGYCGGYCGHCGYDDDDCGYDDDDCCYSSCGYAPVCCQPVCAPVCGPVYSAPAACCEPAPSCCAPAPSCCAPAPSCCGVGYGGGHGGVIESAPYDGPMDGGAAPAPPAEEAPAPRTDA